MAINVAIEDEKGAVLARWSGALPAVMLDAADDDGSCLQFVDPYGDTLFNQKQIPTLIVELMNLALELEDERDVETVKDLVTFVTRVRDQLHTYVRFVGD